MIDRKTLIENPEDLKRMFRDCLNINDLDGSVITDIKELFDQGVPEEHITRLAGAALFAGMYGDELNRSVMNKVTDPNNHLVSDYIKKHYIQLLTDTLLEIVHEVYEMEKKKK